jgi:hypothetical protein
MPTSKSASSEFPACSAVGERAVDVNPPAVANAGPILNRSCNGPFAQGPVNRSERRRERRAALDVFANRFLEGHPYLCRATDISREGIRIHRMNEPERPPARFSGFQFQLPGSPEVLTASGEIVFENHDQRTLGIRFTHLSTTVARAIDLYLRQGQTCPTG